MKTGDGDNGVVSKSGTLSGQELAHRDLTAADRDGYEERFVYSTFSLFDQVQLSTTRRAVLVRGKDSILVAGKIDRRFDNDPDYPNQWRPLVRDAQANIQPGPPHPFDRAGGYVKITRLASPEGAVFIECHLVYEEDYGWFDGVNRVKQKAPAMIQEKVRSFRRKLNVATAKKGGKEVAVNKSPALRSRLLCPGSYGGHGFASPCVAVKVLADGIVGASRSAPR